MSKAPAEILEARYFVRPGTIIRARLFRKASGRCTAEFTTADARLPQPIDWENDYRIQATFTAPKGPITHILGNAARKKALEAARFHFEREIKHMQSHGCTEIKEMSK